MIRRRSGFLLLLLPALLGACRPLGARRGKTVIMASGADLQSMNPLLTTHPLARQIQRYALLTTLVRYDRHLAPVPYLASRWTWSPDSLELVFSIRRTIRWTDGVRTTARDAAFTLELAREAATGYPRRRDLRHVVEVRAVDDTTLMLRFDRPQATIPDVLTDLAILPAHRFAGVRAATMREGPWNLAPVGNGPFRFVRHEPNRRWVFEANPRFPAELGRPAIDRLVVAVVDEPTTKLASLSAGELDFAGIQPAHADYVRRDPRLTVLDYPLLFSYAIVFNARRPPFNRAAVRRAVDLAVDRQEIVSGYLFGFGTPAGGPLPPELGATARPFYAPGRGRALLARPLRFELLTVGSGEAALEQMIQHQLARIGVTVTIRQLELAAFTDRVYRAHDFDAAVLGISGDLGLGYLGQVLDLSGVPAAGEGRALLPVFADSIPAAFLYHARGVQGMSRRMGNVAMDLRGELASLTRWTVP